MAQLHLTWYPQGNPFRIMVLNFGIACIAGCGVFFLHGLRGAVHWWSIGGYALIGACVSFICWGSDVLWRGSVVPIVSGSRWSFIYCTRIPFWWIGGAISYTLGMLLAKKLQLIGFYDIPVKPIFILGGQIGCAVLLLLSFAQWAWLARLRKKVHENSR